MIGYFLALVPLYIFLYQPLYNMIYGPPPTPPSQLALNESFIALGEPLSCPSHNFDIHIFSREPLIIYITSFLSPEESQHLLAIR